MDDEWDRERHDRHNRIIAEQRQRIYERQNEERVRERHDRQNRIIAEQRQRSYEQQDRQREEWRKKEYERIHGESFNDDRSKTWAEIAEEHERNRRRKDTERMIDSLRVGSEQWYKEQEEERQRARHWSFD